MMFVSGSSCSPPLIDAAYAKQPALLNGKPYWMTADGVYSKYFLYWTDGHRGRWYIAKDTDDSSYYAYTASVADAPPSDGEWREACNVDHVWRDAPALTVTPQLECPFGVYAGQPDGNDTYTGSCTDHSELWWRAWWREHPVSMWMFGWGSGDSQAENMGQCWSIAGWFVTPAVNMGDDDTTTLDDGLLWWVISRIWSTTLYKVAWPFDWHGEWFDVLIFLLNLFCLCFFLVCVCVLLVAQIVAWLVLLAIFIINEALCLVCSLWWILVCIFGAFVWVCELIVMTVVFCLVNYIAALFSGCVAGPCGDMPGARVMSVLVVSGSFGCCVSARLRDACARCAGSGSAAMGSAIGLCLQGHSDAPDEELGAIVPPEGVPPEGVPVSQKELEAALKRLMAHTGNAQDLSCLQFTFAQSNYKKSYNQCGKPRHGKAQWGDPLKVVQCCLPKAFDLSEWRMAIAHAGAGTDLHKAGEACTRLWTAGPLCRMINQVIMGDDANQLNRMMPFIRCFNDYLLSGGELMQALTVFRTSRLTREQAARIDAGLQYRIGMYVATTTNQAVADQLQGWQAGESGVSAKVTWVFTVPAGCRQVKDIHSVSKYEHEVEVTMVPYTAVKIDRKEGTTIYATVLPDAYNAPETLATILA